MTGPNYSAQDNLGTALMARHDMDGAVEHFRIAAALEPDDPLAELNIGFYQQGMQQWKQAIASYRSAIAKTENIDVMAKAYSNLGYAYCYLGDLQNARQTWQRAVELAPDTSQAWLGLGIVAQRTGDLNGAIQNYLHANQVQRSGLGYLLLARALHDSGHSQEAEQALQIARSAPGRFADTQQIADALVGR